LTGGHAAPKQERVRKDTHAVVVGDDVVVIKFLENVDFCDNLLSVALGHALKIEFLAGEDDPVRSPPDFADGAKGACAYNLQWLVGIERV